MRWEKLFADIEAQSADDELAERDALVKDLREGEQAATSWLALLGGHVVLEISGVGRVEGGVLASNERLVHLQSEQAHILVNPAGVMAVLSASRRARPVSAVAERLGWPSVSRMLQRDRDQIRITRLDRTTRSGIIDLVGADFLRLRDDAGQASMIPYAAIAIVSCPR